MCSAAAAAASVRTNSINTGPVSAILYFPKRMIMCLFFVVLLVASVVAAVVVTPPSSSSLSLSSSSSLWSCANTAAMVSIPLHCRVSCSSTSVAFDRIRGGGRRGGGGEVGRGDRSLHPPLSWSSSSLNTKCFSTRLFSSSTSDGNIDSGSDQAMARASSLRGGGGSEDEDNNNNRRPRPRAVVIGGGPVGLASALVLSNPPHSYDVTVCEATSGDASTMSYDPTKAYLYNVNSRGQALTRMFPASAQVKLEERGVPSGGLSPVQIVVVPGDPDLPCPEPKDVSVGGTKGGGDGGKKSGSGKEKGTDEASSPSPRISYWIPRHDMVKLLYECVMEQNQEVVAAGANEKKNRGYIHYEAGMECVKVRPVRNDAGGGDGDESVQVTVRDKQTGRERTLEGMLVVGADGWQSAVRECLHKGKKEFSHWPGFNHRKFKVKKWISPASGLKIKVLQFPPKFEVPNAPGLPPLKTKSATMYAIRSINTGPRDYVSFGLLPMKDENAVRATNVITRPNHDVWTLRTGEDVRSWFERSFPRLPFQPGDNSLVSSDEWDRFATAHGTTFPPCQRTSGGLAAISPGGKCGVVLVGDAIHAFPPDLGQGINAGLMDVVWLDRAMRGVDLITGEKRDGENGERHAESLPSLGEALGRYEKERGPEIKALVKCSRFGAPYQYNQAPYRDRIGKALWMANLILRTVLNKVTFGLFPMGSILMAQDPDLTFRQIMRRADLATATLWSVAIVGVWRLVRDIAFVRTLVGAARGAMGL